MEKQIELKPCPFCGGEAEVVDTHVYLDKAIRIKCTSCSCVTKQVLIDHPKNNANGLDERTRYTREQVIEKAAELWNRRTK